MTKKLPKIFTKKLTNTAAILFIVSFVAGLTGALIADSPSIDIIVYLSPGSIIIAILPALFLTIVIHELGHVFGGWIAGQKFRIFSIGPLAIIRRNGKLNLKFITRAGLLGSYASIPENTEGLIRKRFILLLMGPVFSLLFFGIFAAMGIWLRTSSPLDADLLVLTSIASGVLGLLSIIPVESGGQLTDGGQLITLIKRGEAAEALVNILHLQNMSISGTRPRDLDQGIIQRSLEISPLNETYRACFHLFAYVHYLDSGDLQQAKNHLDKSVENYEDIAKRARQAFSLEAAFFEVFFNEDLETAKKWLRQSKGGLVEPHVRARVEAAVAVRSGDFSLAKERIKDAREDLLKSLDKGGVYLEEDLLQQIEDKSEGC